MYHIIRYGAANALCGLHRNRIADGCVIAASNNVSVAVARSAGCSECYEKWDSDPQKYLNK